MTHYTVNYNGLTFLDRERQALADCESYMGDQWEKLVACIKHPENSLKQLRLQLAIFVGIEGYPVGALFREFRPECNETGDYGDLGA